MTQDTSSFVERYQLIFEKDPDSKVFAPLAEAYRRMGLVDEAIDLGEKGVKKHPHFSSGRVALGKCYAQKGNFDKAIEHLKLAADLSPENILAHQILADCYLKKGQTNNAMQAYKMVLFLNPGDDKVASLVKKLENDVFSSDASTEPEDFAMEKLAEVQEPTKTVAMDVTKTLITNHGQKKIKIDLERELALLDTRFERRQWKEVKQHLMDLKLNFPNDKEVINRFKKLEEIESGSALHASEWISPLEASMVAADSQKVKKLQKLLAAVESRRKS